MIVDAHVHVWAPGELHYPWLETVPALRRTFTPADYAAATDGCVDRIVVVEANAVESESVQEVAHVERLAASDSRIGAIVAFADMTDRALDAALDALAERPLVRGVRHNIQGHPAGFCVRADFIDGVRTVGRRDLTFDLCVTHDQLDDALALVRACPDTRFVLDHGGKPPIDGTAPASWSDGLARLAASGDVWCKLSGLLTEADAPHRTPDQLRPYAERMLEAFGLERVMFGSDWPVVTLAGGFGCWRDFVQWLTESWTPAERQRLLAGTAAAAYGIDLD